MIKVLSIVPYKIFPAKVGGQKGIALFNEYFAKTCDLTIITVKTNDPAYAKGYMVLNNLGTAAYRYINPATFFVTKKLIKDEAISHLILEHPYFGWLGMLLKKFTRARLVIHSHNIESTRWKSLGKWWWKILWWYEGATHRAADYNFFIQDADREFAIQSFKLNASKCTTITYGIEIDRAPGAAEKANARQQLCVQHQIMSNAKIFLFNGALDYGPNMNAVENIIDNINPLMLSSGFDYKIIICGRGLPEEKNSLKDYADKNIVYAGFVDDITIYFKGADVFINPVVEGGGIKTKMVEALGYNTKVVSTQNGSIGVTEEEAGGMLTIVADNYWDKFVMKMISVAGMQDVNIPASFYNKFYWGNVTAKAKKFISITP